MGCSPWGLKESDTTEVTELTAHTWIIISWAGIKPTPPALQAGFLTTGQPRRSLSIHF